MKKFIFNSILFIIILNIGINIRPLYLLYTGKYKINVVGSEIYHSLFKSKQKKKTKKLLLGDSVGNQMFRNTTNNDTINSLACNQAIGMVGQFILLNNYINAGNQVDTVYLIYSPFSFLNNLDQIYTFHYFLKPFYVQEYLPLFTETVFDQIHKIPYYYICRYPYILTSDWSPNFRTKDKKNYTFLSPVSVEYLHKITELSEKHHFKLIILPPPTRNSLKHEVGKIHKNEIVENNLTNEFENYFEKIIYLNDTNFKDATHLKNPLEFKVMYENKMMK